MILKKIAGTTWVFLAMFLIAIIMVVASLSFLH